jgi:hypothetical protein
MMNERELTDLWTSYAKLAEKITDHGDGINRMLEDLGDRILMCPAEPRNDSPGCEPGGLVQQAITVAKGMKKLNDGFSMGATTESILLVGLFHEIGKIGNLDEPYFVPEEEGWRRDKLGAFYKPNERLSRMTIPERSLFLLNHYGVKLAEEEFMAIRGPSRPPDWVESRLAPTAEPTLTILLRSSRDILVRKVGTE